MEALEEKVHFCGAHYSSQNSPRSSMNIKVTGDILEVLPELELSPLPVCQENSCWQASRYCIAVADVSVIRFENGKARKSLSDKARQF
ncbi:hypothetical protein M513_11665 [Trichuris suis]|nr:hypothetical protein M513_11665 [Trichuris suis]